MSNTSETRTRRINRKKNAGKKRKRILARDGSTPVFPIHPDAKPKSKKSEDSASKD